MDDNETIFEFKDSRLISLNFSVNKDFIPGPEIPTDLDLGLEHSTLDDNKTLRLFMRLSIDGEKRPFSMNIEMGSIFYFPNNFPPQDKLEQIAEINCAAIIYPFLREVVADITRRAGMSPLLLQPVNFINVYMQRHPEMI